MFNMKKSIIMATIYFVLTSFTIIGNPFAIIKVVTIPIYGIILTLPWSLIISRFVNSATVSLEIGAVLNAIIIYLILKRLNNISNINH